MDKIILDDGKYAIEYNGLECEWNLLRHGEQWGKINLTELPFSNMFITMFYEANNAKYLRDKVSELEKEVVRLKKEAKMR